MPKKSKKFIDKRNSVTFHLVHRSQQDPLAADENAPQRVLLPLQTTPKVSKEKSERLAEQEKFGVFFDDDYNYLQHMRDTSNVTEWIPVESDSHKDTKLKLPSSVFASSVEEEVGLLNKAAPSGLRLDLDPDIVAAMDEDFDFSNPLNELEDNFIELANCENESDFSDDYSSDDYDDEANDEIASLNGSQFSFQNEETKSHFTDYSMSSSVIRRNAQLTLLDDRFEKMYSCYDENELGALDCEEIEGDMCETSDMLKACTDEYYKQKQNLYLDKDMLELRMRLQQECGTSSEDENESNLVAMLVPEKEKWDCESILSTYSNIYNHPKLITEPKVTKIKINPKTGIPVNVLNCNKLTAKALLMLDQGIEKRTNTSKSVANSMTSLLSTLSIRNKNESPDDKKKRKRLLKEYRKDRREEKKLNTKAFREENICQAKIAINIKNNLQGNKIL